MNPQITQHNNQNALHIDSDAVRCFCIEMLRFFKLTTDELIIHFISVDRTKVLHGLFFNDTTTTDCMTFPIDGVTKKESGILHTLGECFINPEEAIQFLPEDPYRELSRYIIHCILHCAGHCDETDVEQDAMRLLEDEALSHAEMKKVLLSNPHPLYT